jgi:hypothetical protein
MKHHSMKMCGGLEIQIHVFLSSTLDDVESGQLDAPVTFTTGVKPVSSQCIGEWVSHRANLGAVDKRSIETDCTS